MSESKEKNPQKVEAGRKSAQARKQKEADILERLARLESLDEKKRLDLLEEVKVHNLGEERASEERAAPTECQAPCVTAPTERQAVQSAESSWTPWFLGGGLGIIALVYMAYGLRPVLPTKGSTAQPVVRKQEKAANPQTRDPFWHGAAK